MRPRGVGTPFWVAAKNADAPFMRLLASHGANPLLPNRVNVRPLMAAAGAGFMQGEHPGTELEALDAVKLAIELGTNRMTQQKVERKVGRSEQHRNDDDEQRHHPEAQRAGTNHAD